MKTKILILTVIVALLLILGVLSLIYFNNGFTGSVVQEREFDYTYTTAICENVSEGIGCRDFHVVCLDGEFVRMDPVSGMVIFPDDWEDRREKDNEEFCGS